MNTLPDHIGLVFVGCVLTVWFFLFFGIFQTKSSKSTKLIFLLLSAAWLGIVSILSLQGFFQDFDSRPPRLILFVAPVMLLSILFVSLRESRDFLMKIRLSVLTYIHIVRIPVELVLWWLFLRGMVPGDITFEGINFDILTGISAPVAAIFLIGKGKNKLWGILWNIGGLILLFNVVIRAILATPYFYDPALFAWPNLAVFYFPFILLPTFVVPAVFFCHVVSLVQLFSQRED